MVGGIAQEIDAQTEVCRKQRELEEAQIKLAAIRKAKYKLKGRLLVHPIPDKRQLTNGICFTGYETSGDDTDGYISSAPEQDSR